MRYFIFLGRAVSQFIIGYYTSKWNIINYAEIKITTYKLLYKLKTQLSQKDVFRLKPFFERTAHIIDHNLPIYTPTF